MPAEVTVPEMGESVLEATVGHWLKHEGQPVSVGEVLVELETDKVNAEVAADRSGVLQRILHAQGDIVHPGEPLAVISEGEEGSAEPAAVEAEPAAKPAVQAPEAASHASPIAQRMAAEVGLDLASIQGSGPGGRIRKEDVERATHAQGVPVFSVQAQPQRSEESRPPTPRTPPVLSAQPTPTSGPELPAPASPGQPGRLESRRRLSRRRLTIARRLVEAQHAAAMLTTFNEADLSAVMAVRGRQRQPFKELYGVDLGYMSFFIKASVAALKLFPEVNAELQGEELVLKHYYDIGVAIGDPEGLVVPVIRDAQQLTFANIEQAIAAFVEKAQDRALTLDDLRGGTFTITNGGVYGSLMSTPILNPPQVAILGMHKIEQRPVAIDGQVQIRPMMYLALSYDHRVVDGREAVQFLAAIKRFIEQPELLLLDS
jgi:2-oxoglutarate dehydrogenase E2 component (dihydrolipoamide succinyltransferase)